MYTYMFAYICKYLYIYIHAYAHIMCISQQLVMPQNFFTILFTFLPQFNYTFFLIFSNTNTHSLPSAHTHCTHRHTRWQLYSMKCEKNQRYRSNIKIIVQSQKKSNKKEKKRLPQTTQCTLHMCECFCAFIQRKTTTIRRYSRLH